MGGAEPVAQYGGLETTRTCYWCRIPSRCPPQAYCRQRVDRSGQRQFVPDPVQVQQHLARGASLVLNEIETLVPGILRNHQRIH